MHSKKILKKFYNMKRLLFTSLALIFSAMIFAQQNGPAISWIETVHDFGVVSEEAGLLECSFEFVNTGNEPLVLQSVKPSCGCTSADWSKEPVAPGAKGYVKAGYNPKGRGFGNFNKSITVTTNETQPTSYLRITGDVPNPNPQQTGNNPQPQRERETFDRTISPQNVEPTPADRKDPPTRADQIRRENINTGTNVNNNNNTSQPVKKDAAPVKKEASGNEKQIKK